MAGRVRPRRIVAVEVAGFDWMRQTKVKMVVSSGIDAHAI